MLGMVSTPRVVAHSFYPGKAVDHGPARTQRTAIFFETMSKRRKGFASETKVQRGVRIVHGDKELVERVGRNDLCPCGSGKRFKKCCRNTGCFRRRESGSLLLGNEQRSPPDPMSGGLFRFKKAGLYMTKAGAYNWVRFIPPRSQP